MFQFASINELMEMGGHGVYVWSAYAVSILALVLLTVIPRRKQKRLLARVAQQQQLAAQREKQF